MCNELHGLAAACMGAGHYEVIAMLPDDYTSAKGSLFILQPGTRAVVFDLDGTITVGDSQVRAWANAPAGRPCAPSAARCWLPAACAACLIRRVWRGSRPSLLLSHTSLPPAQRTCTPFALHAALRMLCTLRCMGAARRW